MLPVYYFLSFKGIRNYLISDLINNSCVEVKKKIYLDVIYFSSLSVWIIVVLHFNKQYKNAETFFHV